MLPSFRMTLAALALSLAGNAVAADAAFPATGHVYEARFSAETVFRLDFRQPQQLTYTVLAGPTRGKTETVHYTAVPVAPNIFMVYWQEADGTRVVHVENFQREHVWTNIALPDGGFLHLDAPLTQDKSS